MGRTTTTDTFINRILELEHSIRELRNAVPSVPGIGTTPDGRPYFSGGLIVGGSGHVALYSPGVLPAPLLPVSPATFITAGSDAETVWIDLNWLAPVGYGADQIAGYYVKWRRSLYDLAWQTTTTVDDTIRLSNLVPNTLYDIEVSSQSRLGTISAPLAATGTTIGDTSLPGAVTGIILTPSVNSVQAVWTENSEPDVADNNGRYQIQIDTLATFNSTSGHPVKDVHVAGTGTVVAGLATGSDYFFRIRAEDSSGNQGPWSPVNSPSAGLAYVPFHIDPIPGTDISIDIGGGNMVTNSSFEADSNSDGMADDWAISTSGGGAAATYTLDNTRFFADSRSARVVVTTNTGTRGVQQSVDGFISGLTYTVSAWVYSSVACQMNLVVSAFGTPSSPSKAITAGSWQRLVYTSTAALSGAQSVAIVTSSASVSVWIDGVQVEMGDVPTAYAPRANELLPGSVTDGMIQNLSGQKLHDGVAPASSPTPVPTNALGMIALTWTPTPNGDPVTYEIHSSTTSGFTPDRVGSTTLVGKTNNTWAIIRTTPAGTALGYGVQRYYRLVSTDLDGAAAAGGQVAATALQAAGSDLSVRIGGGNLVPNGSFEDTNASSVQWNISGPGTLLVSSTSPLFGANCLAITPGTTSTFAYSPVFPSTGLAGQQVTISFYARADATCTSASNATTTTPSLGVQEATGATRFLTPPSAPIVFTPDWTRYTFTGTIPLDVLPTLRVILRGGTASGAAVTVYYDGVQVVVGDYNSASAFFAASNIVGESIVTRSLIGQQLVAETITVAEMGVDSVSARQIQAKSISTEKFTVGVRFNNAVANPGFEDTQRDNLGNVVTNKAASWIYNWHNSGGTEGSGYTYSLDTSNERSGASCLAIALSAATVGTSVASAPIPVVEGEVWAFEADIKASVATTTGLIYRTIFAPSLNAQGYIGRFDTGVAIVDLLNGVGLTTSYQKVSDLIGVGLPQVTVPSGMKYMQVVVYNWFPDVTSTLYVDNVIAQRAANSTVITPGGIQTVSLAAGSVTANVLSVLAGGGNLVQNSSFEDINASGRPGVVLGDTGMVGWNKYNSGGPGNPTVARSSTAYHGQYSCQLTWTTNSGNMGLRQAVPVGPNGSTTWPANSKWMVSCWVKHNVPTMGPPTLIAAVTGFTDVAIVNPTPVQGLWQRYVFYRTIDGTDRASSLYIKFTHADGDLLIDGVQVQRGDVATGYAPSADELLPGTISALHIEAGSLSSASGVFGVLSAGSITTGTLSAALIGDDTVPITKITASTMSIHQSIDLGNGQFYAGSPPVTGLVMNSQGLRLYNASAVTVALDAITGTGTFTGDIVGSTISGTTNISIGAYDISPAAFLIEAASSYADTKAIKWVSPGSGFDQARIWAIDNDNLGVPVNGVLKLDGHSVQILADTFGVGRWDGQQVISMFPSNLVLGSGAGGTQVSVTSGTKMIIGSTGGTAYAFEVQGPVKLMDDPADVSEIVGAGASIVRTVNNTDSAYRDHYAATHVDGSDPAMKTAMQTVAHGELKTMVKSAGKPYRYRWNKGHGDGGKRVRLGISSTEMPIEVQVKSRMRKSDAPALEKVGADHYYDEQYMTDVTLVDSQVQIAILWGAVQELLQDFDETSRRLDAIETSATEVTGQ